MTAVRDLIAVLDELASPALAEGWDNVGLLVGSPDMEISSVMVALDPTLAVFDEAKRKGCNAIVTHHPLILKGLRAVRTDLPEGRLLARAITDRVAVVGCHTNLDKVTGGVNDALAQRLGLINCRPLAPEPAPNGLEVTGFGRIGELTSPMTFPEFAGLVREKLALPVLKAAGIPPQDISRVAVCGGSGSDLAPAALARGAQVYLSSEIKHHVARWAEEAGFCIIDGGHFATENVVVEVLAQLIREGFARAGSCQGGILVAVAEEQGSPFRYYY